MVRADLGRAESYYRTRSIILAWKTPRSPGGQTPEPVSRRGAIERVQQRALASGFRLSLIATSPSTVVFRGQPSSPGLEDVAIKIFLDPVGNACDSAAVDSFRAMEHAAGTFEMNSSFGMVMPICVLPGLGALITEWVPGETVGRRLVVGPHGEAFKIAERAGGWLRHLHSSDRATSRPVEAQQALNQLKERTSLSDATNPKIVLHAIAVLEATTKRVAEGPHDWAICHGDFKPSNLLLNEDGRLLGCDIAATRYNFTLGDVAHFLNHAASELHDVRRPHRWKLVPIVEQSFCHGYFGGSVDKATMELLNWTRLAGATRVFINRSNWSPSWRLRISGHSLLWLIKRLITEGNYPEVVR